jgi:hypothetical protein
LNCITQGVVVNDVTTVACLRHSSFCFVFPKKNSSVRKIIFPVLCGVFYYYHCDFFFKQNALYIISHNINTFALAITVLRFDLSSTFNNHSIINCFPVKIFELSRRDYSDGQLLTNTRKKPKLSLKTL